MMTDRRPFGLASLLRAADIGLVDASRKQSMSLSAFLSLSLLGFRLKSAAHGNRSARRKRKIFTIALRSPCASPPHHQSVDLRSGPTHRARFQDGSAFVILTSKKAYIICNASIK